MEFRGFVNQGRLNALSQYFHMVPHPDLIANKATVQNTILSFFDSVKHKITHSAFVQTLRSLAWTDTDALSGSYVIDFYIQADGQPIIIELNPFHIGAGPCLFRWKEDRDLFLNGPFEFRIVESEPSDAIEAVPPKWTRWIRSQLAGPDTEGVHGEENSNGWCMVM